MTTPTRALVTGAGGFVGRALVTRLAGIGGLQVVAASRCGIDSVSVKAPTVEHHAVGEIDGSTGWRTPLRGCDVVIHLAARAHVLQETAKDPRAAFRRTNADGTRRLAEEALRAGVRRFVLVSTIGVCGAESAQGQPIGPDSPIVPHDAYSESKAEAEAALRASCTGTGMDWTIVRPPMVYGPKAPGNFAAMLAVLARRVPLPLAAVHNKRSLVAIDNLIDLLALTVTHSKAARRVLTVSDGEDLSTPDLLQRTARAMGLPGARLFAVPPMALSTALRLMGRARTAQRLIGSLEIDIRSTQNALGWRPPIGVADGLRRAVA